MGILYLPLATARYPRETLTRRTRTTTRVETSKPELQLPFVIFLFRALPLLGEECDAVFMLYGQQNDQFPALTELQQADVGSISVKASRFLMHATLLRKHSASE